MAARLADSGFGLRPVTWFFLVVIVLGVVGYILWMIWPKPVDYCKTNSTDAKFQVTPEFCHMSVKEIKLVNDDGKTVTVKARIADELAEQQAGYQNVGPEIIAKTQILFVFTQEISSPFHMCNVKAPLDVAWFKADGAVVDTKLMEPGPTQPAEGCPALYQPENNGAYLYALEARKDFFKENKISKDKSRLVVESLK